MTNILFKLNATSSTFYQNTCNIMPVKYLKQLKTGTSPLVFKLVGSLLMFNMRQKPGYNTQISWILTHINKRQKQVYEYPDELDPGSFMVTIALSSLSAWFPFLAVSRT